MSRYQYLPWVREGAAHAFDTPDNLAPVLARTGGGRCRAAGRAARQRRDARRRPAAALRPGRRRPASTRASSSAPTRSPAPADFEPNYLACIEFDAPDFPWLFTPAAAGRERAAAAVARARRGAPDAADMRAAPDGDAPLPMLDVPVSELPDLAESWAWAHAQVRRARADRAGRADARLAARAEPLAARLPAAARAGDALPRVRRARVRGRAQGRARRWRSTAGRRGPARPGLGRDDATACSCRSTTPGSSRTGTGGDFESLARRLQAAPSPPTSAAARCGSGPAVRAARRSACSSSRARCVAPGELTRPAPTRSSDRACATC